MAKMTEHKHNNESNWLNKLLLYSLQNEKIKDRKTKTI